MARTAPEALRAGALVSVLAAGADAAGLAGFTSVASGVVVVTGSAPPNNVLSSFLREFPTIFVSLYLPHAS
ncbi:hypothetical protein D3C87_1685300 [compost metagenome]